MLSEQAAIAANRFGLGARPGDGARIGNDASGWLEAQLAVRAESDSSARPASAAVLEAVNGLRLARQRANRLAAESDKPAEIDRNAIREYAQYVAGQYRQQVAARHVRAIESDLPFRERLVQFWSNHFAVSAEKQPIGAIAALCEDEAIRPRVTGRFRDLLGAVEQHPAMLLYLDNQASIGPSSMAATAIRRNRGRELGLNENLAREILELHTLGVHGGYTQDDVTEFARVLTGWSVGGAAGPGAGARDGRDSGKPGEFQFRALVHEPGSKRILGQRIAEGDVDEGEAVLDLLASHPATARHVATKLARHFVADDPPAALVDTLASTYLESDGELLPVYHALIAADESWREPLSKHKTPQDFIVSTFRALGQTPENTDQLTAILTQLGQRPFSPGSPAGWPDTAAEWDGGDALLKRIEWAAAVGSRIGDRIDAVALVDAVLGEVASDFTRQSIGRAESGGQALALLVAAPEFQRR